MGVRILSHTGSSLVAIVTEQNAVLCLLENKCSFLDATCGPSVGWWVHCTVGACLACCGAESFCKTDDLSYNASVKIDADLCLCNGTHPVMFGFGGNCCLLFISVCTLT